MSDDDFDREVDALIQQIGPMLSGKPFAIVTFALIDLLYGGVDDRDDFDYVNDAIKVTASGIEFETVTLQ